MEGTGSRDGLAAAYSRTPDDTQTVEVEAEEGMSLLLSGLSEEDRGEVILRLMHSPAGRTGDGNGRRSWALLAVPMVAPLAAGYSVYANKLAAAVPSSVLPATLGYLVEPVQPSPIFGG